MCKGTLELTPGECLVVEDAPNGIRAGKAAGVTCLGLTTGFFAAELQAVGADWIALDLVHVPPEVLFDVGDRQRVGSRRPWLVQIGNQAKSLEIRRPPAKLRGCSFLGEGGGRMRWLTCIGGSGLFAILVLAGMAGCRHEGQPSAKEVPAKAAAPVEDLATSRKGFVTKLRIRRPAPQPYEDEMPLPGVRQVAYASGDLKLKGWLSADPEDGKKRPGVVFLHGGFSFGSDDWKDAEPFAKAGFVLFLPMLRGENGNPGAYESFLGEVDDAIAAGRFAASLPNVDGDNVFVAGHSVGAVLTCLAAMLPSPYKAAAAYDGYVDMKTWAAHSPPLLVPYDRNDPQEVRVRNPLEFATSLRCPLRLFASENGRGVSALLEAESRKAGKECELIVVAGDHRAMVSPAVQQTIVWFRQKSGK